MVIQTDQIVVQFHHDLSKSRNNYNCSSYKTTLSTWIKKDQKIKSIKGSYKASSSLKKIFHRIVNVSKKGHPNHTFIITFSSEILIVVLLISKEYPECYNFQISKSKFCFVFALATFSANIGSDGNTHMYTRA